MCVCMCVCVSVCVYVSVCVCSGSHFDALHSLVDALQQSLVLRALVTILVGVHVGQGVNVAVKVLLGDWLLSWYKQQPITAENRKLAPPSCLH